MQNFNEGDYVYFIGNNLGDRCCFGGQLTKLNSSDDFTFYFIEQCYRYDEDGNISDEYINASGEIGSLYASYTECKSQLDKMFEEDVAEYYNDIKGNLKDILLFPKEFDIYSVRAAFEAYSRAIEEFL